MACSSRWFSANLTTKTKMRTKALVENRAAPNHGAEAESSDWFGNKIIRANLKRLLHQSES